MRYIEFKIVESLLFELTDKVKNQVRDKFKNENPDLEDEKINYYLDRWDKYAKNFDPKYRDITRLSYEQVQRLIDDAATKAELKGGGERRDVNPDEDLIHNKNNLVIHKGDMKEKCIAYGEGYSWCISRKDASNMFYSYRMKANEPVFYFVFDKDKTEKDIWHKVVIYVDTNGVFNVATSDNPGDKTMTWEEIEQKQPKLRGLKSLFKSQPLSPGERADYEKYGKIVDDEDYNEFSLTDKYKYIRFGHQLTPTQQDDTPDELIPVYAKLMPVYITRTSWDRLKPRDKRYVQELQKQVMEQTERPHDTLDTMYRNGLEVTEEIQIAAVKKDLSTLHYIKNPSERVEVITYAKIGGVDPDTVTLEQAQLAAFAKIAGIDPKTVTLEEAQMLMVKADGYDIRWIKNPSEEIQMIAVKQDESNFLYIKNPSKKVQIYAFATFGNIDPNAATLEEAQLAAVKQNSIVIKYMKNPSEAVQLAAIKENSNAIDSIENPSERVQIVAVQKNGNNIRYIKNPSETVEKIAYGRMLGYSPKEIENYNFTLEELKMQVARDDINFQYIKNPSEAVQIKAVTANPWVIQYIKKPSEKVQMLAISKLEWEDGETKTPHADMLKKISPRVLKWAKEKGYIE